MCFYQWAAMGSSLEETQLITWKPSHPFQSTHKTACQQQQERLSDTYSQDLILHEDFTGLDWQRCNKVRLPNDTEIKKNVRGLQIT